MKRLMVAMAILMGGVFMLSQAQASNIAPSIIPPRPLYVPVPAIREMVPAGGSDSFQVEYQPQPGDNAIWLTLQAQGVGHISLAAMDGYSEWEANGPQMQTVRISAWPAQPYTGSIRITVTFDAYDTGDGLFVSAPNLSVGP